MIARIWHGAVPVSKGHEYLGLMCKIALPEYQATQGNRGAWCLHRGERDARHFQMLTFWDDTQAIKRFSGDDYNMAKYYDFDSDYLTQPPRIGLLGRAFSRTQVSRGLFKKRRLRRQFGSIARIERCLSYVRKV